MWYIHAMSYYLATVRSKQSHLQRCGWIQSLSYRVRHIRKRKNKYHILMHMYRIQKNAYDVPICRPEQRCRHREETRGHSSGRGGGMNWELSVGIYTLPCGKQIASANLLSSTGSSVITQGGGMTGREAQKEGDVGTQITDSLHCTAETSKHCNAIIFQIFYGRQSL